jgi:AcrR family transcriptional regulator
MPKITAATVAEHRALQHDALLAAARDLLLEGGYSALSFAALGARTGLARPTVYSYFGTRDDIVVALCEKELPLVGLDIERAVARAHTPHDRLAAFVRAQLRAAQDRRYGIAHALNHAPLTDDTRRRIVALHRQLMPSAATILADLGHPHPALAAGLLQGLINAAVLAVDAGHPPQRVTRVAVETALAGFAPPSSGTG